MRNHGGLGLATDFINERQGGGHGNEPSDATQSEQSATGTSSADGPVDDNTGAKNSRRVKASSSEIDER